MKFRVTVLCDNSVGLVSGTLGEHGFSALVEWDGGSLLFDTGGGDTLVHNATRLNRDLRKVSGVALSHGHYDHTGGLRQFLQLAGRKAIYAHPALFTPRYRVKDTGEALSIGIPFGEAYLRGIGAEFDFCEGSREIAPAIFLTGNVPRRNSFETGDSGMFCDSSGCHADPLADDQSLVIVAEKGLVLLLGCCHAGVINTIEAARELTGVERVQAVIGGTHLGFCTAQQLAATMNALRSMRVGKIYGAHCTGFHAAARMQQELAGQFHPAMVGTSVEIK
ncbi:7, 8-dihydropterin-6-methyl-4-(beta-D-ribofuranosyl)- aminobenzene-5'-phosphate synthase [Geobacter sp. OR-1]|uniref:MBL fold metallo-hydrolase n=1 Tax=Geobacter sp. OR-1 TaxID=1266765 RepID=UPI0005439FC1|nr:MBL fold metallo-hydrolase [Geobacter sp. OR-1]GAM09711.1 7, 8-dihydropterin-6-methyl-4-(beta-D-ribofuranosyl)- aminobenzene-5'-phosphate synthase [Geobacter sp. OR-1]